MPGNLTASTPGIRRGRRPPGLCRGLAFARRHELPRSVARRPRQRLLCDPGVARQNLVLTAARPAFPVLALDHPCAKIAPRQNWGTRMARRRVCKVTFVIRNAKHLPANLANAAQFLEDDFLRYANVIRRACGA